MANTNTATSIVTLLLHFSDFHVDKNTCPKSSHVHCSNTSPKSSKLNVWSSQTHFLLTCINQLPCCRCCDCVWVNTRCSEMWWMMWSPARPGLIAHRRSLIRTDQKIQTFTFKFQGLAPGHPLCPPIMALIRLQAPSGYWGFKMLKRSSQEKWRKIVLTHFSAVTLSPHQELVKCE